MASATIQRDECLVFDDQDWQPVEQTARSPSERERKTPVASAHIEADDG